MDGEKINNSPQQNKEFTLLGVFTIKGEYGEIAMWFFLSIAMVYLLLPSITYDEPTSLIEMAYNLTIVFGVLFFLGIVLLFILIKPKESHQDKKGQNSVEPKVTGTEDIIREDASQIIITKFDVMDIMGSDWDYSTSIISTRKQRKSVLSEYIYNFSASPIKLNSRGTVKGNVTLEASVTVFRSINEAKDAFKEHERIFGNKEEYDTQKLYVGDEGFSSIWCKSNKKLPSTHHAFLKRNVLASIYYGYEISGKIEEIDETYVPINPIREKNLVKRQAARVFKYVLHKKYLFPLK
ncbi:MAG: hypothetical protein L6408_06455 [Nanoarchaeota archaeon]|nr:hypothetical protein [Nanoarchaeota archaeon]